MELFLAVAEVMGLEVEVRLDLWSKVKQALEQGEIDAVTSMFYSPIEDYPVEFSQSYNIIHHGVFSRKGTARIQSLANLQGKQVIVQQDSNLHEFAVAQGLANDLVLVETQPAALRLLASGKYDYALAAERQGLYLIDKFKFTNLTLVGQPFLPQRLSFAVPEGNTALLDQLNLGLDILKETGRYQQIYDQWFGILQPRGIPFKTILWHTTPIIVCLLIILFGIALWSWRLKRQVVQRTHERSEAQGHLSDVLDAMPSILVGVDAEMRVTHWNSEAEQETGVSYQVALGRYLGELFPQFLEQLPAVQQTLVDRRPRRMAKVLHIIAEEQRYADIVVYPLGAKEAVVRIDDVTHQARFEKMMVQTEKVMSLGGLAAGLAHEINNPLGAIVQGSQNVLRRLSPDLSKNIEIAQECGIDLRAIRRYLEQREVLPFLEDVREQGRRAAKIVTSLLQFSRCSEDQLVSTDLIEILTNAVVLAKNDYSVKRRSGFPNIEIVCEFDQRLPPIPCIGIEIEQVILNLITNAAQAMRGEAISTLAPRIILRSQRQGNKVRIEVEDNGPGMDEKTCYRVFEPFFTTKPPGVGTGLGLAVSYFIITEHHHGSMMVESTSGKGTKFIIVLPMRVSGENAVSLHVA